MKVNPKLIALVIAIAILSAVLLKAKSPGQILQTQASSPPSSNNSDPWISEFT
ncbi:MAG: hypothetical protein NUV69_02365 [Candidatus Curtissbacteria bacterium]|nr:hypothetical protein [Candidatus Curtissbacteria bacterium]